MEDEKKNEYKTILNCFDTVIRYNGYESIFREIYKEFQNFIEEGGADKHERWFTMDFDESDKFCYGQVQALRMMLVEMFGGYGTSPRYGWIEDEKGFGFFLSIKSKITSSIISIKVSPEPEESTLWNIFISSLYYSIFHISYNNINLICIFSKVYHPYSC